MTGRSGASRSRPELSGQGGDGPRNLTQDGPLKELGDIGPFPLGRGPTGPERSGTESLGKTPGSVDGGGTPPWVTDKG